MTEPHYAQLAARALADEPVRATRGDAEKRARIGAAIAAAIEKRAAARARRRYAAVGVVAALAAAAAVVAVVRRPHDRPSDTIASTTSALDPEGTVRIERQGSARAAGQGDALAAGDHVVVGDSGAASITLSTGTHLRVGPGADLAIVEQARSQVFQLAGGSVRADVAKLRPGERFIVRTSDAELEVRGTSFLVESVAPEPRCGNARTRLTVYEGVVAIRTALGEKQIAAGGVWPSCAPADPVAPAPSSVEAPEPPPSASASSDRAPSPPPSASSVLRDQNTLFAGAMASKRSGDVAGAMRQLDQLLRAYPSSPLAENARAERMRMLTGPAAVHAAEEYLRLYPHGYARSDALAIVAVPE